MRSYGLTTSLAIVASGFAAEIVGAAQIVNQFNDGGAAVSVGNPGATVWDLPSRRQGVIRSSFFAVGEGTVEIGELAWDIGVRDSDTIVVSAWSNWPGSAVFPFAEATLTNTLTFTILQATSFSLHATRTSGLESGAAATFTPVTGSILDVPTGEDGELVFFPGVGSRSAELVGRLTPGDYRIDFNAVVRGPLSYSLTLTVPGSTSASALVLGLFAARRRTR